MTILEAARKDLGVKESPSGGFDNKAFEVAMVESGYRRGWTWNSIVLCKWMRDAFPERAQYLTVLFEHSAVVTFRNLEGAGFPVVQVPTLGSLAFWQRVENGAEIWLGRAGVVSKVLSATEFLCIEGSVEVQEVRRTVERDVYDGLKVIGFVTV